MVFLNPERTEPDQPWGRDVAEQQTSYEFVEVKSEDILRERQAGWDGFTQFMTWSIALTVILLALMAFFLV